MDTADTDGILGSKCCDNACPIAVQRGESFQVGLQQAQEPVNFLEVLCECRAYLDPSTSQRIASRDGQHGR